MESSAVSTVGPKTEIKHQQKTEPLVQTKKEVKQKKQKSRDIVIPRTSLLGTSPPREGVVYVVYHLMNLEIARYFDSRGKLGKLEQLGFTVGKIFTERFVCNVPRLSSTLDIIKFLCKNLWVAIFGKQIDKLQTNHKGIYVLYDNNLLGLSNVSLDYEDAEAVSVTKKLFIMPCGIIRGALGILGLECIVRAEFSVLPSCIFNVQLLGKNDSNH